MSNPDSHLVLFGEGDFVITVTVESADRADVSNPLVEAAQLRAFVCDCLDRETARIKRRGFNEASFAKGEMRIMLEGVHYDVIVEYMAHRPDIIVTPKKSAVAQAVIRRILLTDVPLFVRQRGNIQQSTRPSTRPSVFQRFFAAMWAYKLATSQRAKRRRSTCK